jgi:hypothetical protein
VSGERTIQFNFAAIGHTLELPDMKIVRQCESVYQSGSSEVLVTVDRKAGSVTELTDVAGVRCGNVLSAKPETTLNTRCVMSS